MKISCYLIVAFIISVSFALQSCSNDDERIENSEDAHCSIVVDGVSLKAKNIAGEIWEHNGVNYLTIWVNSIADDDSFIFEVVDEPNNTSFVKLEQGVNLVSAAKSSYPTVTIYQDDNFFDGDIITGNAILSEFSRENKKVTIELTNCKFRDYMSGDIHTISGLLSTSLKGADNKVKL